MIELSEIAREARRLQDARPEDVLAWAADRFTGRVALTLSFGGGGVVLAHMLSAIDRSMPVVFIDTGFLFPETLAFKDLVAERYDLHVVTIGPRGEPGPLYMTDKDACCTARKVEPMQRLLPDYDALVSGIRRDQSEARAVTDLIEYHDAEPHPIVKVHPLATWTRAEVWRYIADHDVPSHPLLDHGYTSIGCWPCTQPTLPGEAERAGRWRGSSKTECGLHTSLTTRRRTTGEP